LRFATPGETLAKAQASVAAGFSELLVMIGGRNMPGLEDPRKRAEEVAALLPRLRALG